MMKKLLIIVVALISIVLIGGCAGSTPHPTSTTVPPSMLNKVWDPAPVCLSSIGVIEPGNPAGPTVKITLVNYGTKPVVSIKAVLQLEGEKTFEYDFPEVSTASPLQLGDHTSQTLTLIGPTGYSDEACYPLTITVTLQNRNSITYTTKIQIKNEIFVR
jgi:hypothetical protein